MSEIQMIGPRPGGRPPARLLRSGPARAAFSSGSL